MEIMILSCQPDTRMILGPYMIDWPVGVAGWRANPALSRGGRPAPGRQCNLNLAASS